MREIGRLARALVPSSALVKLAHPPFDVLVSLVDGAPCAIEDACNHAGASLAEGTREGDRVRCVMHGYVFSLVTGELEAPRGLCEGQRRFAARFEGDDVVVYEPLGE